MRPVLSRQRVQPRRRCFVRTRERVDARVRRAHARRHPGDGIGVPVDPRRILVQTAFLGIVRSLPQTNLALRVREHGADAVGEQSPAGHLILIEAGSRLPEHAERSARFLEARRRDRQIRPHARQPVQRPGLQADDAERCHGERESLRDASSAASGCDVGRNRGRTASPS